MKKILLIIPLLGALMVSCVPNEKEYFPDQIVGKWVKENTTLYYRFDSDMHGASWDTSEDYDESEAQAFDWEIDGDLLSIFHRFETSEHTVVPEAFTITSVTENTLSLTDDYNRITIFKRV